MIVCRTVWTYAKPAATRAFRSLGRGFARHAVTHAALAAATVCVAVPTALFALLPPSVATVPYDAAGQAAAIIPAAVSIPEPSTLLVVSVAVMALALVRLSRP